jgi:hypothetical protein
MGNYSYRNWSSVLVFGADLYAINGAGSVHKFDSVSNTLWVLLFFLSPLLTQDQPIII